MESLVLVLIVLGIVLVVVTVVGHGIWVLLAWMFRGAAATPARSGYERPWAPPPPLEEEAAAAPVDEWAVTSARVGELFQAGLIDPATFQAMDTAIHAHLARQIPRAPEAAKARAQKPPPLPVLPIAADERVEEEEGVEHAAAAAAAVAPPPVALGAPHGAHRGFIPPPPVAPAMAPPAPVAPRGFYPPPPRVAREPARPLSQVLASFMESRNIRWGELVGGLLIVGCSVALALSFWAEIAQRPLMKFSVFTAVTAALFSLGLYSEHRWKLPTTSRGILLISTLLVPLNFLAFAAFARGTPAGDPVALGGEAVAFALFLWLAWLSARVIAPQWPALLTGGLMALSTASLAVRYLSTPVGGAQVLTPGRMLALSAAVVACYEAAGAGLALKARRWKTFGADAANAVLLLLGVLSCAAVFPLVLAASRSGPDALHRLAPLLGLAGLPAVAAGLLLWRRVQGPALARLRATGTGVAVLGAVVLLAGIALAWPDPGELLPAAGAAFAALFCVAVLLRVPVAHAPAAACAALAYLVGFHVAAGHVGWTSDSQHLLAALGLPSGGAALAGFVVLAAAGAAAFRRRGWDEDGRIYLIASFAVAVASALLLAWGILIGTGSTAVAAAVFGLYAVLWLACAAATASPSASRFWLNAAQVAAALATAAVALALAERGFPGRPRDALADPATWKGIALALAALSLLWAVARLLVSRAGEPSAPGEAPRRTPPAWLAGARNLTQPRFTFDHLAFGFLLAVLAVAAVYVVGFGTVAEFAPRDQSLTTGPSGAAAVFVSGPLPWLTLALLMSAHALTALGSGRRRVVAAVLEVAWVACPLFAVPWCNPAAAAGASALRWAAAVYLLLGGAATWRRRAAGAALPVGLATPPPLPPRRPFRGRISSATESLNPAATGALLLVFGILPIAALSLFATGAALGGEQPTGPLSGTLFARLGPGANYAVPLLVVACGLVARAVRRRSGGYALAALLSTNLLATAVYAVAHPSGGIGWAGAVRVAQLNIAVAGGFSLAWLAALAADARRRGRYVGPPAALAGAVWAALGFNVLLIVPAAGALFLLPGSMPAAEIGGAWGWAALGLSSAAALGLLASGRGRVSLGAAGAALPMLAAMAGLTAAAWDRGDWVAYHTWMAAQTAAAWAMLGLGWWLHRRPDALEFQWEVVGRKPRGDGEDLLLRPAAADPGAAAVAGATTDATADAAPPTEAATAPTLAYLAPGAESPARGDSGVRESAARWAAVLGHLSILLALRAAVGDPAAPWPSVAATLFIALMAAASAVWLRAPRGLYAAGVLLNLAATLAYVFERGRLGGNFVLGLLEVNAAALALPSLAWLVLDLHVFRRPGPGGWAPRRIGLPFHRFAAGASVALLAAVAVACVGRRLVDWPIGTSAWLDVAAFAAVGALLLGCLRDESAKAAPFLLYVLGLAAAAKVLDRYGLSPQELGWFGALVLAGYGLLTSALWANRVALARVVTGRGSADDSAAVPGPSHARLGTAAGDGRGGEWLPALNMLLAALVIALAFWADFTFATAAKRLAPALAAAAQAASLALLAGGASAVLARRLRSAAVPAALLGAVAAAWAVLDPAGDADGLRHAALAAVLTALAAAPAALALLRERDRDRAAGAWAEALRSAVPVLVVFCLGSLAAALALEGQAQASAGRVEMPPWAVAGLGGAALLCCVTALAVALHQPPQTSGTPPTEVWSDRGRAGCVYLAEALLAAMFLHVRLTLPWLFHGFLRQYWPVVVMAIAFAGVGVGEALRGRRWAVLAGPLQRTGAFLPLLPVLAFWTASSNVHYTALMALVGALYALLAVLRHSTAFGLLAALAGNVGLWYLLHGSETYGFLVHPQLWVIPAALSALAAVELNRRTLPVVEVRAARYFCLVAVYLSSTADIFINGSAHSPWLPLVLAGLSVAGVLAGVSFRVRPFLFVGTGFLVLSLLAIIYNASASLHVTWIWYVAGIALGLFIIFLFALFEKKRATMLALVEGLRDWE